MDSGSSGMDSGAGFISFLPIAVLGGMGMGSLVGRIAGVVHVKARIYW